MSNSIELCLVRLKTLRDFFEKRKENLAMQDKKEIDALEKDYLNDLNKIKETIRTNQNKVMVVVNSAMIMMYYEIGTIINKRKT